MFELRRLLLCGAMGVWSLCTIITVDALLHRCNNYYHLNHHVSFISSDVVHAMSSRIWCRPHHDDGDDHSDDDGYNDTVFNPARYSILPVLHNVESHHCDELSKLLVNLRIPHCSLSLRHPTALQSMSCLIERLRSMDRSPWKGIALGISTVTSTDQIDFAKQHGLKFVSTTSTDDLLLRHVRGDDASAVGVSMLSGCETYEDCMRAIRQGVRLLKFYPSFKVPPDSLRDIVSRISNENDDIHIRDDDDDNDDNGLRIFVAGSVKLSDLKPYLDAGATNFAIGIDLSTISSMHEVGSIIKQYEREIHRWRKTVVDDDTVIIS